MSYFVLIRNNETKETRKYEIEIDWKESDLFWWTDGNFGCDGNRELCFKRAAGEDTPGDEKCGKGKYTVIEVILPNGESITIDGD